MRMNEMDKRLLYEGFNVDRRYDSATGEYVFNLRKDGRDATVRFKYDGHESQVDFIKKVIQKWDIICEKSKTTTCVYQRDIGRNIRYIPQIKDVIFNGPATIVKWADGTKTVVKCCEGDEFDAEKGLAIAISKKALGDCKEIKKWAKKYEEEKQLLSELEAFRENMRKAIRGVFGL
jgi:hypothetical protein